jgi:hypothetical protein
VICSVISDVTYAGHWGFGYEVKTDCGSTSVYLNNIACFDYSSEFADAPVMEGTIIPQYICRTDVYRPIIAFQEALNTFWIWHNTH